MLAARRAQKSPGEVIALVPWAIPAARRVKMDNEDVIAVTMPLLILVAKGGTDGS